MEILNDARSRRVCLIGMITKNIEKIQRDEELSSNLCLKPFLLWALKRRTEFLKRAIFEKEVANYPLFPNLGIRFRPSDFILYVVRPSSFAEFDTLQQRLRQVDGAWRSGDAKKTQISFRRSLSDLPRLDRDNWTNVESSLLNIEITAKLIRRLKKHATYSRYGRMLVFLELWRYFACQVTDDSEMDFLYSLTSASELAELFTAFFYHLYQFPLIESASCFYQDESFFYHMNGTYKKYGLITNLADWFKVPTTPSWIKDIVFEFLVISTNMSYKACL